MSIFLNLAYFLLLAAAQTGNLLWSLDRVLPNISHLFQNSLPAPFWYLASLTFFSCFQCLCTLAFILMIRFHTEEIECLYGQQN